MGQEEGGSSATNGISSVSRTMGGLEGEETMDRQGGGQLWREGREKKRLPTSSKRTTSGGVPTAAPYTPRTFVTTHNHSYGQTPMVGHGMPGAFPITF